MMRFTLILALAIFISPAPDAWGEADTDPVTVRQLTNKLCMLFTDQGSYTTNTLAFIGDDGLLLVDTQAESDAEALHAAVMALGYGPPKYIINTHRHVEHVGGNAIFGDAPVVIAHRLVPAKLRSGSFIFEEYPPATFPDITISDSLTLYFNGDTIRIIALPGSHDDNEIIVHFINAKVVHLSSLVNGFNFPSVDSDGDALRFAEVVNRAIQLLPDDVTIVSGHNDVGTWSDLHAYRDMLENTTQIVKAGLAAGKDAAQLQAENVLEPWQHYAGSYVSTDRWIQYLADALQQGDEPRKQNIYEPIYYAMKAAGVDAGIAKFRELKSDTLTYGISEIELLIIGDKLLDKKRTVEAERFLHTHLEEYPESPYNYFAHYDLSLVCKARDDREAAIKHCARALELKPDFQRAVTLLAELKAP